MSPEVKLLAIDTATEACSAALAIAGTIRMRYEEPGHGHAERILRMIDELLVESGTALAQLDAIAFGRGPGAFTGLRIAAGVAQGLAFGAGLPVIAVSDLAGLAERALAESSADAVVACIDARMAEVYWGTFRRDAAAGAVALGPERVTSAVEVALDASAAGHAAWIGAGTGFGAYPDLGARLGLHENAVSAGLLPRAREIALIAQREFQAGRTLPAEEACPVYLRDSVAVPSRP